MRSMAITSWSIKMGGRTAPSSFPSTSSNMQNVYEGQIYRGEGGSDREITAKDTDYHPLVVPRALEGRRSTQPPSKNERKGYYGVDGDSDQPREKL